MTGVLTRRSVVRGLAAACAVGCARRLDSAGVPPCTSPSKGTASYCLVEALVVRVPGAASLSNGGSILTNVDDSTAVIVGRDAAGLFARSAICTHACCIVSLCSDETCGDLVPTPDTCGTIGPAGTHVLCTCHGSRFQLSDGAVLNGPATTALPCYAVTLDGDDALVDTGTPADPSARA